MPNGDGPARRRTLMEWIVGSSLRFRFLVAGGAAVMLAVGVLQFGSMRVDTFPEFAPPTVEIQTNCLGLSTSDVESLVTVPIEQVLNGIQGLDVMRSKSVPQLSSIQLIFKQGTDLLQARQLVQERLATVSPSLPTWAAPPVMLPPVSATSRVMQIGMSSRQHSLIAMSMMAYWTIRARILRVPGVANVAIWGERLQLETVQVEPTKMQARGVTLDSVMQATSDSVDHGLLKFTSGSIIGAGGALQTGGQQLSLRNVLPIITPADLARSTAPAKDGTNVPLGDIAHVVETSQPLIGDAIVDGGPGLLLVVERLPWGNTLDITKGVTDALNSLQPGLPDVKFDTTVFKQSTFIDTSISNLTRALLIGFILVLVILTGFLFEWRVALISLLTIPLSLLAAILVLNRFGATVNTMTLAGLVLALGAVVDDAIIDLENILRRLRDNRTSERPRSTAAVILSASLEVRSPIVYATLIIVAAAIPVLLLQGLTGAFFQPLMTAYVLAIVASMVVALTVTPALTMILLRNVPVERRRSPLVGWLQRGYQAMLSRIVHRPSRAYAVAAVLAVIAIVVTPQLGQSLFPQFKERSFLIHWITAPGTSDPEERRIVTDADRRLRELPGVQATGTHIGQAILGEEIAGVNFAEEWVTISPDVDYDRTIGAIHTIVNSYPGIYHNIVTYLNERIEEVLTGTQEPIVVRIYGPDLGVLRAKGQEIQHRLAGVSGIADDHVDFQVDEPQVQVEVDLAKAARYGLKPGDIRRAASTLVAGEEVGDIFRAGKAYDVMVWSTPQTRSSVPAIANLPIDTPAGSTVRLGDVADVRVGPVPNLIQRENDSRRIDVSANLSGRDQSSTVADVQKVLAGVSFPRGYHAELLGEYQAQQAAQVRLFSTAAIAAVAILLLLQVSFRSWRLSLLAFFTLPMALVGGVLAAFVGGGVISLGSLVGFFTVFGIAARNGILLINHCQHLEDHEGETFGVGLVLRGARERLSPILMTSLATGLAVVPLIILGNEPGAEIEYPLAVVIVGGLVTSTLLNLFVVPSLYLRFGRRRPNRRIAEYGED
ncbi:MAG TPA: efflux RND transporter permease subunit [Pseudonocardiaceae bacterium]